MAEAAFKKLNLPLPLIIHEELFAESRKEGIPATRLVRSVLEDWLNERRRERRREEVRRFAEVYAGTELDLDPLLEENAAADLERFYEADDAAR